MNFYSYYYQLICVLYPIGAELASIFFLSKFVLFTSVLKFVRSLFIDV